MMDLSDDERNFLLGMRALGTDGGGNEVFAGLSAAESAEYLPLYRSYEGGGSAAGEENPRFAELHAKHETARREILEGARSNH